MSIVEITDKAREPWDTFVKAYAPDGGLLQSWGWGEVQKALGNPVFRLAVLDEQGQFRAALLLVRHELHFEYNYLYAPRGPVMDTLNAHELSELLGAVKRRARELKSFMLRFDPPWLVGAEPVLAESGLRKSEGELQPKCNFIMPITDSPDALLAAMKPKTRYNLGLAQKHGVTLQISDQESDLEGFWQLLKQTSARDHFQPHPKEHYKKMLELLNPDGTLKLLLAIYDQQIVAAALVAFFGKTATYLHGASADLYREVMAPYLLHWEAILAAKQLGCRAYDFGGVNGQTCHHPNWVGMTKFKTGFAPTQAPAEYVGSFEAVINPLVFAGYRFVKQIRGGYT
ncbi:MAG: hypothetical protein A3J59_03055 [Candidatus Buchananbacteria bacterium RIFCSPHIGHO2_02_FULL_56_16]|uniref:BioF2-like acetyltransferase domain-containing protein n=1 Tax=Candidatus Buchananbacteria bacterium RIFCSPHIGHO2_02_FULL_56_16 TaxID=1797542 RepID=A0A1G1YFJ4_9BACT|nr:MAG: hypothetical protein A3J59_03055 [Candidatus Buchananbacteria bacterium RIFCSPHIGHO2_02_FULL_56_16]